MPLQHVKEQLLAKKYLEPNIDLATNVIRSQYVQALQREKMLQLYEVMRRDASDVGKPAVLSVGPIGSPVMIIGEAAGEEEEKFRLPFIGPGGHLLTLIMNQLGIDRNGVYLTNVFKYRPERPTNEEIQQAIELLKNEIAIVKPTFILTLGTFAIRALLNSPDGRIGDLRGKWMKFGEVEVMPTISPNYLLKKDNPDEVRSLKLDIWNDMKEFFEKAKEVHPDWEHDYVLSKYKGGA